MKRWLYGAAALPLVLVVCGPLVVEALLDCLRRKGEAFVDELLCRRVRGRS